MPPKRKAMAETDINGLVSTASRNAKAPKASATASAPTSKSSTEAKGAAKAKGGARAKNDAFKYSNASTLSKKPEILHLQWPNLAEFMDDEDQDMPKKGQKMDKFCLRVSDLGLPISEDSMKLCMKLDKESAKRDQDAKGLHIFNDWNGYAMQEVMSNLLKDFDKDLFKKTVSPFKKWAYTEALACFLKTVDEDLDQWMGCEDGPGIAEVVNMLGLMVLTSYDVLAEHSLFKPDSEITNIGIITLMLLEFLKHYCEDLESNWGCELVRKCDEAGIDLDKIVRKQVDVNKTNLDDLRAEYNAKKTECPLDVAAAHGGDGYKAFALKGDWTPADDISQVNPEGFAFQPEKYWLRWDWQLEYPEFNKNHPGGDQYVISKVSKAERREHSYGRSGW